jgi:N-methylhydantoinase A
VARYLVGVDVGGTFTDFVSYDVETGAMAAWKNLSTPMTRRMACLPA